MIRLVESPPPAKYQNFHPEYEFPAQIVSNVPNKSCTSPHKGVFTLVPIHKSLASGDSGVGSPAAAQHDVVFPVKEIGRVLGIQGTSLESVVTFQNRAGPLPRPAHLGLSAQLLTILGDGRGVEVFEAHIAARKIDEELTRIDKRSLIRAFSVRVKGIIKRGRLLYAIKRQMPNKMLNGWNAL